MTAEEFLKKYQNNTDHYADQDYSEYELIIALKEFAKHHVTEALKAASENVEADFEPMGWLAEQHQIKPFIAGEDYEIGISRHSILEAYSLENIK